MTNEENYSKKNNINWLIQFITPLLERFINRGIARF